MVKNYYNTIKGFVCDNKLLPKVLRKSEIISQALQKALKLLEGGF